MPAGRLRSPDPRRPRRHRPPHRRHRLREGVSPARAQGLRAEVSLRADGRARTGRHQGRPRHQGVRRDHAQPQRRRPESRGRRTGGPVAVQDRVVSDRRRRERNRGPFDVHREAAVLGEDSARARGRGHLAAQAHARRRLRQRHGTGEALHGADQEAQHDPRDGPRRPQGDLRHRQRGEEDGPEESPRDARRVPVAEPDGRRAEGARRRGRAHRALLHDDVHEQGAVGNGVREHPQVAASRTRSSRRTSARRSIRRSPKASPCSFRSCSTRDSRPTRSARWQSRIQHDWSRTRR